MFNKYIERTENGDEAAIRIYNKIGYSSNVKVEIKDISYTKNGYYICYTRYIYNNSIDNENSDNQYRLHFPETGQHICKRYGSNGTPLYYSSPDFAYEFKNEAEEGWNELKDGVENDNELYQANASDIIVILQ